jgi:hypothetical protein
MRQRSSSITPTYSTDRALLLSSFPTSPRLVFSLDDARKAVLSWGIGSDNTFVHRTNLETDADWLEFIRPCLVVSGHQSSQGVSGLTTSSFTADLELLLKRCYSVAYGINPSPTLAAIKRHSLSPDNSFSEEPTPLSI